VPGGVQGLDRYAYSYNNPVKYTDPSGHIPCNENYICFGRYGAYQAIRSGSVNDYSQRADTDHNGEISETEARNYFVANLQTPGNNIIVSTGFGENCTTIPCEGQHAGVDFASSNPENASSEVTSASTGVIVELDTNPTGDFGIKVVIEHNVFGYKFYSIYAHFSSTSNGLAVGQTIHVGDPIGIMGRTPFATGDIHLHFEVRTSNNVNLDNEGDYLSLPVSATSYWADSYKDLQLNWVNIGTRFGYSPNWPTNWPK
jgi:murein DD-endopeptidase MepM/ murein hydrolase activator NlpD